MTGTHSSVSTAKLVKHHVTRLMPPLTCANDAVRDWPRGVKARGGGAQRRTCMRAHVACQLNRAPWFLTPRRCAPYAWLPKVSSAVAVPSRKNVRNATYCGVR